MGLRLLCDGFEADIVETAILHDALDGTGMSPDELENYAVPKAVVDAVVSLTHIPEIETYEEYVDHVSGNDVAAIVLLYDMQANIFELHGTKADGTPDCDMVAAVRLLRRLLAGMVKNKSRYVYV